MMNIYAPHGTKVRYIRDETYMQGAGNNDCMTMGEVYTVDYTRVSSFNTDVYLVEFPGKSFNVVCFEEVGSETEPETETETETQEPSIPETLEEAIEVIRLMAAQMIEFRDEGFICLVDDEGENIPDAQALVKYYRGKVR